MATPAQHKSKWLHNRQFLGTIADEFPDWMVTVMFYAALHAVENLFAHDGTRTHGGHTARNQTLKTVQRYRNIWRHYRPVFDAARTTRYEVETIFWVPAEDVKTKLSSHLYAIEASVLKLTGQSDRLESIW